MTAARGEPRSKTVTWSDPLAAAGSAAELSGRDHLPAMLAGEIPAPPIAASMDMTLTDVGAGTVQFRCPPDESAHDPIGTLHGGYVCTLLDTGTGCAAQTTLEAGLGYPSLEIK